MSAPQQPGRQPVQRAGALQARAQDGGGDDAHHRVTGEAAEDLLRRDQPGQAQHHQHHQRDHVGADALEQEHHHDEADQPQHQAHVVGQRQRRCPCTRRVPRWARAVRQLRSYSRSQTPWPSFCPRVSKWVCGRQSGRGTLPRGAGAVAQARRGVEHVPHVLGIGLPVGGAVQAAGRGQLAHQQRGELGLDQPALVVALLVPGVREIDAHLVQAAVGHLVAQHFHRIVVVDAHMVAAVGFQRVEQPAHARGVHLDAEVVARRVLPGREAQRVAVAGADLHHPRRGAAEHRVEIAQLAGVVQAEARPLHVERALLGLGEAPLAQHEAADLATAFGDGERLGRGLGAGAGERIGHRPIGPGAAWRR